MYITHSVEVRCQVCIWRWNGRVVHHSLCGSPLPDLHLEVEWTCCTSLTLCILQVPCERARRRQFAALSVIVKYLELRLSMQFIIIVVIIIISYACVCVCDDDDDDGASTTRSRRVMIAVLLLILSLYCFCCRRRLCLRETKSPLYLICYYIISLLFWFL